MSAEAVLTQWALGGSRASPTLQVVQRPYFATGTQCRACIPPSDGPLTTSISSSEDTVSFMLLVGGGGCLFVWLGLQAHPSLTLLSPFYQS